MHICGYLSPLTCTHTHSTGKFGGSTGGKWSGAIKAAGDSIGDKGASAITAAGGRGSVPAVAR